MLPDFYIRLLSLTGKMVGVVHLKSEVQLKGILTTVGKDFIEVTHGSTVTLLNLANVVVVEPKD